MVAATSAMPELVATLLTRAYVSSCCVRSTLPPVWAEMPALLSVMVNSNGLSGSLPDAWGANGSFRSLQYMNLVLHLGFLYMPHLEVQLNAMSCAVRNYM